MQNDNTLSETRLWVLQSPPCKIHSLHTIKFTLISLQKRAQWTPTQRVLFTAQLIECDSWNWKQNCPVLKGQCFRHLHRAVVTNKGWQKEEPFAVITRALGFSRWSTSTYTTLNTVSESCWTAYVVLANEGHVYYGTPSGSTKIQMHSCALYSICLLG